MTLKKPLEQGLGEAQKIMTPEDPLVRYVDSTLDEDFKKRLDDSIAKLLEFSEQEELGVRNVSAFVKEVVLYGSKTSFDSMITSSPGWPKGNPVPANYVGMGEKGIFHVVSWPVYKQIHPTDSVEDYQKLLTHELGHLLHIAALNGNEDDMGPLWFFEGLACLMADQYLDSKLPDHLKIESIIKSTERNNYQDYVSIVRVVNRKKSVRELIQLAKNKSFADLALKDLRRVR
jgi:hypothetical protein